jgi:WD40 repeat protein
MFKISWVLLPDVFRIVCLAAIISGVGMLGVVPPENRHEQPSSVLLGKHQYLVRCLAFAPDGKTLATAGGFVDVPGEIKIWDLPTLTERASLRGDENGVYALAFTPDGRTLATVSLDGIMRQWSMATGQVRAHMPVSLPYLVRTAVAPDGQTSAVVRWDKDSTKILLRRVTPEPGNGWTHGSGLEFRPERHRPTLVSNIGSESETMTLCPDQGHVWTMAFSPDGRTLASGGLDGTVRLWDVDGGSEKAVLRGHTDQVGAVAFSPDGSLLASGSHDATAKLWNIGTGEELATLRGHTGTITCVGFDPTGHWIASAGHDQTVRLWSVAKDR